MNLSFYNPMTGAGPDWDPTSFNIQLMMCWLGLVIVFFVAMIIKKQIEDGALSEYLGDYNYNWIAALVCGLGAGFLMFILFGSPRLVLLIGVLGIVLGGFLVSFIGGE